jgi:hypothetical protein
VMLRAEYACTEDPAILAQADQAEAELHSLVRSLGFFIRCESFICDERYLGPRQGRS